MREKQEAKKLDEEEIEKLRKEASHPAIEGEFEDFTFFLELEKHLNKLFPKGNCEERSRALFLFGQAVLLHERRVVEIINKLK